MAKPKVIFLDALGTLFDVRGGVGEIYSTIARDAGVEVSAEIIERAFRVSFKAAGQPVFPGVDFKVIHKYEFEWWEQIAKATFAKVGVLEQFADFTAFFFQLYSHFATVKPWYVYPDVLPTLKHWQKQGIELGVISNFDTRLYRVLELLELNQYFSSVTISSFAGAAKPDGKIFQVALEKHQCHPQKAWHIGDSLEEDYHGAKAVGIKAFWLERTKTKNT